MGGLTPVESRQASSLQRHAHRRPQLGVKPTAWTPLCWAHASSRLASQCADLCTLDTAPVLCTPCVLPLEPCCAGPRSWRQLSGSYWPLDTAPVRSTACALPLETKEAPFALSASLLPEPSGCPP